MLFIDTHNDPWHRVCGADGPKPDPEVQPDRLLSLEQWHAVREHWPDRLNTGVVLPNTADVLALRADLRKLSLVVLDFPKWTDGRAYSQARLLRSRLAFTGQVRASGDVLVDMLPLLQRTGFDAVQLRADQDVADARRALGFSIGHYQVAAQARSFTRPAQLASTSA
jgi:uncharacterized protein (DUF934 family)